MKHEFTYQAPKEYQERFSIYYSAINQLLQEKAAITKSSVAKKAGRVRSAIKPSREEYKQLIEDIEAANEFINNDPQKTALTKLQKKRIELKAIAKLWEDRYTNLLSANLTINAEMVRLETQLQKYRDSLERLRCENINLNKENAELKRQLENKIQMV